MRRVAENGWQRGKATVAFGQTRTCRKSGIEALQNTAALPPTSPPLIASARPCCRRSRDDHLVAETLFGPDQDMLSCESLASPARKRKLIVGDIRRRTLQPPIEFRPALRPDRPGREIYQRTVVMCGVDIVGVPVDQLRRDRQSDLVGAVEVNRDVPARSDAGIDGDCLGLKRETGGSSGSAPALSTLSPSLRTAGAVPDVVAHFGGILGFTASAAS